MIRGLISVCTVGLLGLLLVYSLAAREPRADFTYVNPSGIHTLDPARMSWTQDLRVALNIWEGLTSYDPKTLEPIERYFRSFGAIQTPFFSVTRTPSRMARFGKSFAELLRNKS